MVAVVEKNSAAIHLHNLSFVKNIEWKHHLVHFRLAVSPDTENIVFHSIQKLNNSFGLICLRQINWGNPWFPLAPFHRAVS